MNSIQMVNEDFQPTPDQDRILEVFKQGRNEGQPWGRANPRYLIDETGIEKGNVEYHLRQLTAAGWVKKIARGLYEFKEDPRENR
ncbi:MarR family transcriptional regulator [Halobacteriaceae archaeon GCM10025711]